MEILNFIVEHWEVIFMPLVVMYYKDRKQARKDYLELEIERKANEDKQNNRIEKMISNIEILEARHNDLENQQKEYTKENKADINKVYGKLNAIDKSLSRFIGIVEESIKNSNSRIDDLKDNVNEKLKIIQK